MIDLIPFEQGKKQLRQDGTYDDTDIESKIHQASAIVMREIKMTALPESWIIAGSPVTYEIPYDIQWATEVILGELFENREAGIARPVPEAVRDMLRHYWDPALA